MAEDNKEIIKDKPSDTNNGTISLIFGILGVIVLFVFQILSLPLGIIALYFGYKAKKMGDKNATIGIILGAIATIIGIVTLIAAIVYVYVSGLMGP